MSRDELLQEMIELNKVLKEAEMISVGLVRCSNCGRVVRIEIDVVPNYEYRKATYCYKCFEEKERDAP